MLRPCGPYRVWSRYSITMAVCCGKHAKGALPRGRWLHRMVRPFGNHLNSSGCETDNWKVHRFGCAHRVEILAKKYDLAAGGTQEDYVILSIDAPGRFDDSFRVDLCDCACRIIKWMDRDVEEAESVNRPSEPRNVTHDLLSPGKPRRMADRWRVGELPQNIIGDQCLPLGSVIDECINVSLQEVRGDCGHVL